MLGRVTVPKRTFRSRGLHIVGGGAPRYVARGFGFGLIDAHRRYREPPRCRTAERATISGRYTTSGGGSTTVVGRGRHASASASPVSVPNC
jgi:hypothetical protein